MKYKFELSNHKKSNYKIWILLNHILHLILYLYTIFHGANSISNFIETIQIENPNSTNITLLICSSGLLHTFWHSMIVHAIATTQKTTSTTFTKNQQTPKHVETQSTSSSISHHFSRSFRTGHHFPRVLTRRCEAKFIKSSGWKTLIENEDWGKKFSERWTRIVWGGK